jgi:hypothetical protein
VIWIVRAAAGTAAIGMSSRGRRLIDGGSTVIAVLLFAWLVANPVR